MPLDDIKHFRQLDSRCPGHPEYRWTSRRRDDDRAARPGRGQQRRHGASPAAGMAAHFNRPGFETVRLQRLRPLRRRLHDGGHLRRGRLAGRPPEARPTSAGSTTTTTSRSRATPTWPSARTSPPASSATAGTSRASATPTTWRCSTGPSASFRNTTRPADADHRRQPHRLRRAAQAGHQRRPRRAARRGGDPAHQAELRLAGGRQVPGARRRLRALPRRASASAARSCATPGSRRFERVPRRVSRAGRPALPDAAPPAARRLGQGPADLPGRRQGHGHARLVRQGAQRDRQERPLADRRRGRPGPVDQDAADVRGGRRLRGRAIPAAATCTSASASTRWAPILNGMALVKVRALRLRLPDLQRLRPAADPAGAHHGDPGHLRLHARLDRRRRGRPDAPADRAARLAAGDPRPDRAAAGRRQRGGRGVEGHHAAAARAGGPGPDAAGAADARPHEVRRRPSGAGQGRLRPGRRAGRQARRPAAGHRQRGVALRRGATSSSRRRASRRAW